jgi:hypothetical protein
LGNLNEQTPPYSPYEDEETRPQTDIDDYFRPDLDIEFCDQSTSDTESFVSTDLRIGTDEVFHEEIKIQSPQV